MMLPFQSRVIERVTRVAALGLRFWDGVRNVTVSDGLQVSAYPPGRPWQRVPAFTNRGDIYSFLRLPGLQAVEFGQVDPQDWSQPQVRRSFVIEVQDRLRRFQPFCFTTDAPVKGVLGWDSPLSPVGSPPEPPPAGIPLFPSAAYRPPAGMAVVRADLRQLPGGQPGGQPASWAILEAVRAGQTLAWGWADKMGRTALIFPYPELETVSGPSGSVGSRIPLTSQSWTFQLRARFQPALADQDIPDLRQALAAPSARLWASLSPAVELGDITLEYGAERVLRSLPEDQHSELFLSS